jgi:hypothetical protein
VTLHQPESAVAQADRVLLIDLLLGHACNVIVVSAHNAEKNSQIWLFSQKDAARFRFRSCFHASCLPRSQ